MGGGPRILRSLFEGSTWPVVSIAAGPVPRSQGGSIPEYYVGTRPTFGALEGTRARGPLTSLEAAYVRSLSVRLEELARAHRVSAIHSVVHGFDFLAAHRVARALRVPLLLTFHDHPAYTFAGGLTRRLALRLLVSPWRDAEHRYVISRELGEDLGQRYGNLRYSVVTDGIEEVTEPRRRSAAARHVYFMGAFHVSYRGNLLSLLQGLAQYRDQNSADVSVVVRGGCIPLSEREKCGVPVRVLPWGAQSDIEEDLKAAGMLYLPLPFGPQYEYFVRFSLSTKLVTFLAAGLPILFHGPRDSAAARLLADAGAAICAYSLDPRTVAAALEFGHIRGQEVSAAAGVLARARFRLATQRDDFWRPLELPNSLATGRA